jgi:hypothetical protein
MELIKRANGSNYKFSSNAFIVQFINLCKEAQLPDMEIREMLDGMENTNIDNINKSYIEA